MIILIAVVLETEDFVNFIHGSPSFLAISVDTEIRTPDYILGYILIWSRCIEYFSFISAHSSLHPLLQKGERYE